MRAFLYVVGDFLRANLRLVWAVLIWGLGICLVLLSATALWRLPPYQATGPASSQRFFLLTLSPLLSEADITKLAWSIWAWSDVVHVAFRFPGESDPEPIRDRTLVVEVPPGSDREETAARLGKLPGVTKIAVVERTTVPPQVPSSARIGAVVALVVTLGLALFWGARVINWAQKRWKKERDLLRGSGAPWFVWRGPTFFLAGLTGIFGAGIHLGALWAGGRFIPAHSTWSQLVSLTPWTIALSILAGLILGLLSTLLSPHS
ncbi:MAG: hypothetical protein NZ651_01460 [Candidatus Bipolaricaulota bacterium]|nr:hypothetical protein [Candidatus Bipolaricaulota bacterium]MDW8126430.1 hypothetical protein [Candidatus Bipolaricaulota bacterium]